MTDEPIPAGDGELLAVDTDGTMYVYRRLRAAILDGTLEPGTAVSQVQLASTLKVSRTTLREALRLLQTERLVSSEFNRRVRIAPLDIDDLEQLYAMRITLESLGVRLTVARLSDADLADLSAALTEIDSATDGIARVPHRRFHSILFSLAGGRLAADIGDLWDYAERYRLLYVRGDATQLALRELARDEHHEILDAALQRDADRCAGLVAEHLARTALTIISRVDGMRDPHVVRSALRQARSRADA